mgnify:CR=1 FL=1
MKIVLTSISKIKESVVLESVKLLFPNEITELVKVDIETTGPEPTGEQATLGQISKALEKAKTLHPDASFYVGMEGGVRETDLGMEEIAYVVIENNSRQRSVSQAVSFPIPPEVAKMVRGGVVFAEAVNQTYATNDIKNNQGFIGLLTNQIVSKKALYFQPTVVAFSKYLKDGWFFE